MATEPGSHATAARIVPDQMKRMRRAVAISLRRLADWVSLPDRPAVATRGALLVFVPAGRSLGHDRLSVLSARGQLSLGMVEWSAQWNRARFKADPEAVFDSVCVAEIYAAMKGLS